VLAPPSIREKQNVLFVQLVSTKTKTNSQYVKNVSQENITNRRNKRQKQIVKSAKLESMHTKTEQLHAPGVLLANSTVTWQSLKSSTTISTPAYNAHQD
jgi:hypothetical protein